MAYATARLTDFTEIPLVDMAPIGQGPAGLAEVAAQVQRAAIEVGFFYVKNHGVPPAAIDAAFAVSRRFFALPAAAKNAIAVNARHRGYIGVGEAKMYGNKKPDLKESFVYGLELPESDPDVRAGNPLMGPNLWPAELPEMARVMNGYFAEIDRCGRRLLGAFAAALDLPAAYFTGRYTKPIARGSLVYYPPQPPDLGAEQFGVGAHTDYGCITFVAQDAVGGLQARNRSGEWVTAPPAPGTLVVNIGDLMARWTNDRFSSTPHRVVNASGRARYSMAVFYDPDFDARIEAIPSCVAPGEEARYPVTTCGEHILGRFGEAFAYRQKAAE
jgi:isopenicillin N synthase-like dioxygenase